jgi:hypothetical protein
LTPSLSVGLAATTASWSAAFRSYVRDHGQGVELQVVMDRSGLRRAQANIDVFLLDDVMRTFSALDVFRARDAGIHVLGLSDHGAGMGRQYLMSLGVDQVVGAAMEPQELLGLVSQIRPRQEAGTATPNWPLWPADVSVGREVRRARGVVSAWTKVSGGTGLTESVVAAAEFLSSRARVLVIEAEEVAPILVSRLLRSPEGGLPWALSRVRQGLGALPEGLSGARDDGTTPVGRFDVICAAPGAAHVVGPAQLEKLVIEAATCYDYVLVETGWLVGSPSARERFSAARKVLQMAGSIVVMAAADPEGAARLVQWKAAAMAAGVGAPCWAGFGRARKSRYEKDHLRGLVESNTGRHPYSGFVFLPEDVAVERARWNAEMAGKGPWQCAVRDLVGSSLAGATIGLPGAAASSAPVPAGGPALSGGRSGLMAV